MVNAAAVIRQRPWLVIFCLLALAALVTLAPVLNMGFVTDDFVELGVRHFDALDSLGHDDVGLWLARSTQVAFVDLVTGWQVIRPFRQLLFAADYLVWQLNPFGYHLTNFLLHLATTFLVALISFRFERRYLPALIAGLLFVIHPAHSAPIAEISSRGHILATLFLCLTVLFYMLPRRPLTVLLAWVSFVLALGSKETAIVTPALLLLYELVANHATLRRDWRGLVRRQLRFWLSALGYVALRFALFGQLDTSGNTLGKYAIEYQMAGYSLFLVRPFLLDINDGQVQFLVLVLVLLLVLYHKRPAVVFGLGWIPITLAPTLTFPPEERYLYTATVGLMLALGSILANPFPRTSAWAPLARAVGIGLAALLMVFWGRELLIRVNEYRTASLMIQNIVREIQTAHPTLPSGARVVLGGVPIGYRRAYLFTLQMHPAYALRLAYQDPSLKAELVDDLPITFDNLDRTFYFEYGDGALTERADRVTALAERAGCGESADGKLTWKFDDAQGWEPWNQIEDWRAQDGVLAMRTTGTDPFLAGPIIQVAPNEVKRVEIEMAATSSASAVRGELYWLTTGMADFSADARAEFVVPTDGAFHTLKLKIAGKKDAGAESPIVRLRLDPADTPAKVRLASITIVCR